MMKPKKNPVTKIVVAGVKAAAKAAGVKPSLKAAQKAKPLTTPKSAVKVKPGKQEAPIKSKPKLGDIPSRGAKPTTRERINRARDLQWDKAERFYEASNEISMTGLKSTNQGRVAARGAGKKNMRKRDAIRTEANKNLPIQINSARPFKSTGADPLKTNNARALKAANKSKKKAK